MTPVELTRAERDAIVWGHGALRDECRAVLRRRHNVEEARVRAAHCRTLANLLERS